MTKPTTHQLINPPMELPLKQIGALLLVGILLMGLLVVIERRNRLVITSQPLERELAYPAIDGPAATVVGIELGLPNRLVHTTQNARTELTTIDGTITAADWDQQGQNIVVALRNVTDETSLFYRGNQPASELNWWLWLRTTREWRRLDDDHLVSAAWNSDGNEILAQSITYDAVGTAVSTLHHFGLDGQALATTPATLTEELHFFESLSQDHTDLLIPSSAIGPTQRLRYTAATNTLKDYGPQRLFAWSLAAPDGRNLFGKKDGEEKLLVWHTETGKSAHIDQRTEAGLAAWLDATTIIGYNKDERVLWRYDDTRNELVTKPLPNANNLGEPIALLVTPSHTLRLVTTTYLLEIRNL